MMPLSSEGVSQTHFIQSSNHYKTWRSTLSGRRRRQQKRIWRLPQRQTSQGRASLFRSVPPELRLQIYSDLNSMDRDFTNISDFITVLELDQVLYDEAVVFFFTNHTFKLREEKHL
jgi:hypothetical protein